MSIHILIIGGGLSGLTTAYRLACMGFRVSIVDKGPLGESPLTEFSSSLSPPIDTSNGFPFILHRFQDKVWGLLHELGTASLLQHENPVRFEFLRSAGQLEPFRPFPAPTPFHTLLGLLTFRALPIKDRWGLLNMVEKYWEGATELPHDFESQTSDTWLTGIGQSALACRNVWNPLCQFLLGDSLAQSSANFFRAMVIRGFLAGRRNYETWLPSQDETSLLLRPLRFLLKQKGVAFYPMKEVTQFQCNEQNLTGVILQDGTMMTADGYVAAIPPQALMPCLPERLLAKYSYFCSLANLMDTPALIVHVEVAPIRSRPRLVLSHQPFHWITSRPERRHNGETTVFSCVGTGNQNLLNESDHRILDQALTDIQTSFYPRVPKELQKPFRTQILRFPHCFLSPHPSQSAQRPLQQSPFSNFFLAGPWTDTGLPASRESSILSAQMCAQSIAGSTLSKNIDNLIHQS
jgi:hypothetical protein